MSLVPPLLERQPQPPRPHRHPLRRRRCRCQRRGAPRSAPPAGQPGLAGREHPPPDGPRGECPEPGPRHRRCPAASGPCREGRGGARALRPGGSAGSLEPAASPCPLRLPAASPANLLPVLEIGSGVTLRSSCRFGWVYNFCLVPF